VQLTAIEMGLIIGTGILVLTGEAAGTLAGPGIRISFVVCDPRRADRVDHRLGGRWQPAWRSQTAWIRFAV
jgi:hypothetical protein